MEEKIIGITTGGMKSHIGMFNIPITKKRRMSIVVPSL